MEKSLQERPNKRRQSLTLSDLPEIAIDEILSRLPIKHAVITSALSCQWRRRWHSIPDLDFTGAVSHLEISQILLHPLRRLAACCCACSPIYCWLSTLSLRSSSFQTLTLAQDSRRPSTASSLSINSIARYFPNLVHLGLQHCHLIHPSYDFPGFPRLKILHLETVPSGGRHLPKLISRCPSLETLDLIDTDMEECCLDIVAPNLKHLKLRQIEDDVSLIINAPLLETIGISVCNLVADIEGLARIEMLVIDSWGLRVWAKNMILMGRHIPVRFGRNFDHLKIMSLNVDFMSFKQVSITLWLLRSAPNSTRT